MPDDTPLPLSAEIADHFCSCGRPDCRHLLFIDGYVRPLVEILQDARAYVSDYATSPNAAWLLLRRIDAALKAAGGAE